MGLKSGQSAGLPFLELYESITEITAARKKLTSLLSSDEYLFPSDDLGDFGVKNLKNGIQIQYFHKTR